MVCDLIVSHRDLALICFFFFPSPPKPWSYPTFICWDITACSPPEEEDGDFICESIALSAGRQNLLGYPQYMIYFDKGTLLADRGNEFNEAGCFLSSVASPSPVTTKSKYGFVWTFLKGWKRCTRRTGRLRARRARRGEEGEKDEKVESEEGQKDEKGEEVENEEGESRCESLGIFKPISFSMSSNSNGKPLYVCRSE